jgi:tetratricopeptide (TPR) repeat protein
MAERLEHIAGANPQDYAAYLCRAVALLLRGHHTDALAELESALSLNREQWGAYFWKGMVCAALEDDTAAIQALEQAIRLKMPPALLAPLHWLKLKRADFYARYAVPLLDRIYQTKYEGPNKPETSSRRPWQTSIQPIVLLPW